MLCPQPGCLLHSPKSKVLALSCCLTSAHQSTLVTSRETRYGFSLFQIKHSCVFTPRQVTLAVYIRKYHMEQLSQIKQSEARKCLHQSMWLECAAYYLSFLQKNKQTNKLDKYLILSRVFRILILKLKSFGNYHFKINSLILNVYILKAD